MNNIKINRVDKLPLLLFVAQALVAMIFLAQVCAGAVINTDVCIYGGTSAGIAAAVQSARMGRSVVLTEFGKHLGGLTSGGLGATDIGNKAAIGGISHEFFHHIARYYANDSAWRMETRQDYFAKKGSGQAKASDLSGTNATMWTFEPHVAEEIFTAMLKEAKVAAHFQQRLASVRKKGPRIKEITMENGNVFQAQIFIDASYEGDLMAKAGVSYQVGRESNAKYGETLNGVRGQTPAHQFKVAVDP